MKLARVSGTVVSTIKAPVFEGRTLLVCDLLEIDETTGEYQPTGAYQLAIDTVGAGAGETVILLDEGNGARQVLGDASAPVRTVVAGIVDEIA